MEDKVYWSTEAKDTWEDSDYMTFFLVHRKWWSLKAWKFAMEFRSELLFRIMYKTRRHDEAEGG